MTVVPFEKAPSKPEAQELIRTMASEGKVKFHGHARQRMKKRGITTVQILNCLAKGFVEENPTLSLNHQGWETVVSGKASGSLLRVVVCIRWQEDLLIISTYNV